jgi:hypothetical protein
VVRRGSAVWGLLALSLVAGLAPSCDLLGPTNSVRTPRPEGPQPIIDGLQAQPASTRTKDQPITLTAAAHALTGKALQYNWTADAGTLSSQSGSAVTWRPTTANGVLQPGSATITLTVTAGLYSTVATLSVLVGSDGSAATNVAPRVYGPPVPAVGSLKPSALPVSSPAASATGAATGAANAGPLVCSVRDLVPTWAMPGSIVYIRGQGLAQGTSVTVGAHSAGDLQATGPVLAVHVPQGLALDGSPVAVSVAGCGPRPIQAGMLSVLDTTPFAGDAVRLAGLGLIADVGTVDPATQQVPDLSTFKPVGSYLAPNLDFTARAIGSRFPASSADFSRGFAIRFTGNIFIASPGRTGFSLVANEGAKLYIDSKLVADDEPGTPSRVGDGTADLAAGAHALRVDYYQAMSDTFALQLYWTPAGQTVSSIIPPTSFSPF